MSKRKQRAYPAMVKRRMVEEEATDFMLNCYLSVIIVAAVTGFIYLHICLLKLV